MKRSLLIIAILLGFCITTNAEKCPTWATQPPVLCQKITHYTQISGNEVIAYCDDGTAVMYVWDGMTKWIPVNSYDKDETRIVTDCFVNSKCDEFLQRINDAVDCLEKNK